MSVHQPKLAALLALEEGVLSRAGRARIERHLGACQPCRDTLQALRNYARVSDEIRQTPTPALDWARMNAHVGLGTGERTRMPPRRLRVDRWVMAAVALLSVGAAAAYVEMNGSWRRRAQDPRAGQRSAQGGGGSDLPVPAGLPSAEPAGEHPATALAVAWPTLLSPSAVRLNGPSGPHALTLDASLQEGDRLRLSGPGRLDLSIEGGAALSLMGVAAPPGAGDASPAPAEVWLSRLRRGETVIALQRGRLCQRVPPLAKAERYEVLAAGYHIRVLGTRFSVTTDGIRVQVRLIEGAVAIDSPAGQRVATLSKPGTWQSDNRDAGVDRNAGGDGRLDGPPPLSFRTPATSQPLAMPMLAQVESWRFAGDTLPGELAYRVLVPAGLLELEASLRDGRVISVPLSASAEGLVLAEDRLARLLAPELAPRRGKLSPDALRPVIRASQPALQRCYELALRRKPDLRPDVSLSFVLKATGRVRDVRLRAEDAPDELVRCLERVARGLRFPPPGGPFAFDVPVRFRPRH